MTKAHEVVIAGAGPVGLLLAIELKLAGVQPLVLERLQQPDLSIKAMSVNALAGEALVRRGFGDALNAAEEEAGAMMREMLRARGLPTENPWSRAGGHFAGLFLIDQTRQRAPERRMRGVKQASLEAMLHERLREIGVEVRRGQELLDFRQHEQGVAIQLREGALEAQYLVGCDGGRSAVRKRLGIAFEGSDATLTGYQMIADLDHPERLKSSWQRTATGTMSFGPLPGRVLLVRFDGPPVARDAPITRDELEQTLRYVSGEDVRIERVHQATRWSDNTRQAATYRQGRVFLAGDAAHVHSPFGGQGLGLGLLDAANLGWKLAAAVRGEAPDGLLDSYTSERHPVAARVLANTRAQAALLRPDVQTTALREIVAEVMQSDWGTRFFGEMISGVTVRYDLGDDNPEVGTITPDRQIEGGSIASLMRDGRALLLDGTGELAAPEGVRHVRVEGRSMLIRPDGCIAWIGQDNVGLEAALTRWFGARVMQRA